MLQNQEKPKIRHIIELHFGPVRPLGRNGTYCDVTELLIRDGVLIRRTRWAVASRGRTVTAASGGCELKLDLFSCRAGGRRQRAQVRRPMEEKCGEIIRWVFLFG